MYRDVARVIVEADKSTICRVGREARDLVKTLKVVWSGIPCSSGEIGPFSSQGLRLIRQGPPTLWKVLLKSPLTQMLISPEKMPL